MTLTGLPFLLLLLTAATLLLTGTYVMWDRWPATVALPVRMMLLLLLMAWGALVVLDQINRTFDFYASLSDLVGSTPSAHSLAVVSGPRREAGVVIKTKDWIPRGRPNAIR